MTTPKKPLRAWLVKYYILGEDGESILDSPLEDFSIGVDVPEASQNFMRTREKSAPRNITVLINEVREVSFPGYDIMANRK